MEHIRCGYCNWLMSSQCENILDHTCFKGYNDETDAVHIDENNTAIIGRKEYNLSQELQKALLDVLKIPIPDIDAIDGFLKTLGEALRRLPYQQRVMLQIKFLQMTTAAEFQNYDDNN
ncbi:uncharacterized protein LOC109863682 [Pseudomyrmex gracilis]|uniref:uncharacterized protein LOC109855949 n=1 Tax=Pseudomyrmex gracilis TaxID=219809 RepID=UPI000994A7E9|nr:uncharacterized protein LOC109855949 [Pseudomyrmex gracilis]XP_020299692.1 uncharacterized protein LOC109863682 [Pseudomyrmex gracilis]